MLSPTEWGRASQKIRKKILDKFWNIFQLADLERKSYDVSDFDISFSRGLSLEDGASTLSEFTASIIGEALTLLINSENSFEEILSSSWSYEYFFCKKKDW